MRTGVAIGTSRIDLIPFLELSYSNGVIDYVELYVEPQITVYQLKLWRKVPFIKIVHATHGEKSEFSLPYFDMTLFIINSRLLNQNIDYIVYHPFLIGDFKTQDKMCILENMPYWILGEESGYALPQDMPRKFCFDFSHAWVTAEFLHQNPKELIRQFIKQKPCHFHLIDTNENSDHLTLGTGIMDLDFIAELIPEKATVTIETDSKEGCLEKAILNNLKIWQQICQRGGEKK